MNKNKRKANSLELKQKLQILVEQFLFFTIFNIKEIKERITDPKNN